MLINRWMKGALNAPDGNRPHSHRVGKTEGKHQKAGVVRYSRHEGLAPVRLSIGLETGSGSFAGEFLAGHRIDRPVFIQEGPLDVGWGSVDAGVPSSLS